MLQLKEDLKMLRVMKQQLNAGEKMLKDKDNLELKTKNLQEKIKSSLLQDKD